MEEFDIRSLTAEQLAHLKYNGVIRGMNLARVINALHLAVEHIDDEKELREYLVALQNRLSEIDTLGYKEDQRIREQAIAEFSEELKNKAIAELGTEEFKSILFEVRFDVWGGRRFIIVTAYSDTHDGRHARPHIMRLV